MIRKRRPLPEAMSFFSSGAISGTISGPTEDSYGSMLELTWRGEKPIKMKDGTERKFINDYDTVIMRGHCEKDGTRIGFGEVSTQLLPIYNPKKIK